MGTLAVRAKPLHGIQKGSSILVQQVQQHYIGENPTVTVHLCTGCMDQPGKVVNPARGQLNRENEYLPVRMRISSRETGSAVPSRVSLLISILRLNLVLTYGIPPEFRGGVHLFV